MILSFEGLQRDSHRKNEDYQQLCELTEKIELPAGSPAQKILTTTTKAPTTERAKRVATVLGKWEINRHLELR